MKTKDVAKQLGISYSRLINLIRCEKIEAPEKDSSADFVWSKQDVANAQKAMEDRIKKIYPKALFK